MPQIRPYPVFLDLRARPVLIVGGGAVALRKASGLLEAGARVTIVAREFAPEFSRLRVSRKIRGPYAPIHMKGKPWRLVFAATDSPAVNAEVYTHAAAAGILCCRCDEPEGSDFAGAATAHAGGVTLAISTAHASPALSAKIRDQAAAAIEPALAQLAALAAPWRRRARKAISDPGIRRLLMQQLSSLSMENVLREHGAKRAGALFAQWLAQARKAQRSASAGGPRRSSTRTTRHAHRH